MVPGWPMISFWSIPFRRALRTDSSEQLPCFILVSWMEELEVISRCVTTKTYKTEGGLTKHLRNFLAEKESLPGQRGDKDIQRPDTEEC